MAGVAFWMHTAGSLNAQTWAAGAILWAVIFGLPGLILVGMVPEQLQDLRHELKLAARDARPTEERARQPAAAPATRPEVELLPAPAEEPTAPPSDLVVQAVARALRELKLDPTVEGGGERVVVVRADRRGQNPVEVVITSGGMAVLDHREGSEEQGGRLRETLIRRLRDEGVECEEQFVSPCG